MARTAKKKIPVYDEGVLLTADADSLNFVGAGVTGSASFNDITETIPGGGAGSGHTIQDEGVSLTARSKLNFVGATVTATDDAANDATIVTLVAQPLDATLTALAAYNTNGLLTQTSADTFTGRTITGTANRISLTNGNGVSGNPTIDIDSAYVGQATITTLGTITTGVWTGTAIAAANGGTGQAGGYAVGDILYASGASTLSKLADVATGNALISGGVTTAPAWGKIGLTTHISGTLAVGNGGVGLTGYAIGDLIQASGASTLAVLNSVATGNALISGGVTTVSSWGKIGLTTHVSGTLGVGNGGTGTATAFTLGSLVFAGASGVYTQDNTNIIWDNTNKRLGIGGITSPVVALEVAGNTSNSSGKFGTFELQSFSINNAWLADNGYFNGSVFVRRGAGYTVLQYFSIGGYAIRTSPSSTAGTSLDNGGFGTTRFALSNTGDFGLGGTLTSDTDFTGATITGVSGKVGIGQLTPAAVLHLKAGTATANTAPIKFAAGTALTATEAGTLEFSNSETGLTFTAVSTRRAIAYRNPVVSTTASSATPTPNADTDDMYTVTALAAAAAFGAPTGTPTQGQRLLIRVKDNGTARGLTFNAIYRAGTTVALPTTTTISKTMYILFIYNSTDTKWDLQSVTDGF